MTAPNAASPACSSRAAIQEPTPLLPTAEQLAAALEPVIGWPGALADADFHLERFVRLPNEELGGRYRLEALRPVQGLMAGCLFVRSGGTARGRHEVALPAAGVTFLPFPRDDALPGVHALARTGARAIAWRPGRRAVLLDRSAELPRYWKVFDRKGYARFRARAHGAAFAGLSAVGVVPVVAHDDEQRAIAFAAARGSSLHALVARGAEPAMADLHAGIARFAAVDPGGFAADEALPFFGLAEERQALARACEFAARIRPELAAALSAGQAELADPARLGALGLLHRDLHDKQLFVADDGALQWIDADTLAHGPRALDVANLAAHLLLRQLQGLTRRGAELAGVLLEAAALDPRRAGSPERFFLASSLLRLAAVYALRPRQEALVAPLLAAAAAMRARGSLE